MRERKGLERGDGGKRRGKRGKRDQEGNTMKGIGYILD